MFISSSWEVESGLYETWLKERGPVFRAVIGDLIENRDLGSHEPRQKLSDQSYSNIQVQLVEEVTAFVKRVVMTLMSGENELQVFYLF